MVYVDPHRCAHEGCKTVPQYGKAGTKVRVFCKVHASKDMMRLSGKRCADDRCDKRPTYAKAGSKVGVYCKKHAAVGMVTVSRRRCNREGCNREVAATTAGTRTGRYCSEHARHGIQSGVHSPGGGLHRDGHEGSRGSGAASPEAAGGEQTACAELEDTAPVRLVETDDRGKRPASELVLTSREHESIGSSSKKAFVGTAECIALSGVTTVREADGREAMFVLRDGVKVETSVSI